MSVPSEAIPAVADRASVETATAALAGLASAALDSRASRLEGHSWEAFRASAFEGRARSQGDSRVASVASADKTLAVVAAVEQRAEPLASRSSPI